MRITDNLEITLEGDFIIIILTAIIATHIIAYLISGVLTKKKRPLLLILFILRSFAVLSIALLFFKPVYTYRTVEEETLDVPLILDSSFSLNDAIQTNEGIKSKKFYLDELLSQYVLDNEGIYDKVNLILYDPLQKVFIENPYQLKGSKPYGIFDLDHSLSLINSEATAYPQAVFMSDYGLPDMTIPEIYYTPILFIAPELRNKDVYIDKISFDKVNNSIELFIYSPNDDSEEVDCSLYIKEELITSKIHQTIKGITRIEIALPQQVIGRHTVKAEISLLGTRYDNPLNNVDYVNIHIEKDKVKSTIHYYFDKPSFTTSFVSRHLSGFENYKLKHYYTINNQIKSSKYIKNDDVLLIQNLDEKDIQSIGIETRKAMFKHINDGGKAIFIIPDAEPMTIQNYFFPHTPILSRTSKTEDTLTNKTLKLTAEGKKSTFLTFSNRKTAQKHWDRLNYFDEPAYTIQAGKSGLVLGHINDKPALIRSSEKNIVMFLFGGLWKIDFLNQSYGLNTTYLPDLLEELISKEFNPELQDSLIRIDKQILEFGEETDIYFNEKLIQKEQLNIRGNDNERKLYTREQNGKLHARFTAKSLGKNSIYEGSKLLGEIYVRYPHIENSPINYGLIDRVAKETGGIVIKNKDLDDISSYFTKEVEKNFKIHKKELLNIYLCFGIAILLICIEWIIRKKFL